MAREGGDIDKIDTLQKDLYLEIRTIEAEIDAEFLAKWTLEITTARRKEWNNMVNNGMFSKPKVDFIAVRNQEDSQGWTLNDLRKAIKLNNLN